MNQNGTLFSQLSTETAQNTPENGTTALARVWQNGTVPCRLCRVPSCAVCADSSTEKHKAKLAKDPRFAGWASRSAA